MQFGVCAGMDKAAMIASAGYDYIELSVGRDLMADEDETAWAETRRKIADLPLPVEAFNAFIRQGKIVGPDVDLPALRRYVDTALARAQEVGGKIIVFGSGGARNVPEGWERERAGAQLAEFLHVCADASERTGVIVVIEPLNKAESNILNTVAEGAALARRVGRAGVRNLADSYHMEKDNDPLSAIVESADVLAHVHTADTDRSAPGTGLYDHAALFRALRAANYDARLSIECRWKDFESEIGPALMHLKRAHAGARTT